MRLVIVVVGVIILVLGAVWALQGAYVLPATFMRGPEWIGIGGGVGLLGLAVSTVGARRPSRPKPASK